MFAGGMSAVGDGMQSGQAGVYRNGSASYSFGTREANASPRVDANGNTVNVDSDIDAPQMTEAEVRAAAVKAANLAAIGAGWTFAAQLLSLIAVTIGAKLHRAHKAVAIQSTPPSYVTRSNN
jgi:hypothetical protein